jgi:hypothetical protein
MVTGFIIIVSFIIFDSISLDILVIVFVRFFLFVFESTFNLIIVFGTESSLGLTHGVIESGLVTVVFIIMIIENFGLFVLAMSVGDLVNDLFLFDSSSLVLHVIHVELVLKVVNVCVFLNVDRVETLQFGFKTFVFFLVLGLDILNSLQTFVCTFKLLLSTLDFVQEFGLVLAKLFNRFLHLVHLLGLGIDDVSDALFDVLLLSVGVQVTGN